MDKMKEKADENWICMVVSISFHKYVQGSFSSWGGSGFGRSGIVCFSVNDPEVDFSYPRFRVQGLVQAIVRCIPTGI